jgi:hypothetical protein
MNLRTLEQAAEHEHAAGLMEFATATLDQVVSGRRVICAVCHPLGFYCLPVLREGADGACVHVFNREAARTRDALTTSAVHSHSWQLTSCVLYGDVGNVRLGVYEEPERPTHRIFEIHSSPSGCDDIRPTPRLVRCVRGREQVTGRGELYELPAGEFHATAVAPGAEAATLALSRSVPGHTDLSLGPVGGLGHRMERRMCQVSQTARIAKSVLRRIHGTVNPA